MSTIKCPSYCIASIMYQQKEDIKRIPKIRSNAGRDIQDGDFMSKNLLVHWLAWLLSEEEYGFLTRRLQPLKCLVPSKLSHHKQRIFALCSFFLILYILLCTASDGCTCTGRMTPERNLGAKVVKSVLPVIVSKVSVNWLCRLCSYLLVWFWGYCKCFSSTSL